MLKALRFTLLAALGLSAGLAVAAGFLEREVTFTEAEIQAALDRAPPRRLSYGKLLTLTLAEAPRIGLDGDDGRARIGARLEVEAAGQAPIRIDFAGRAGVRYDDRRKAFFLEAPVADAIGSPTLRTEATPAVRLAVTELMVRYFRSRPIYVLRADGPPQEQTARWLLKSIRIEHGRVVAVLSPV